MSKQIFISYASLDQSTAERIAECLEKEGMSCWYAARDSGGEMPYAQQISQAIKNCTIFLFLLSNHSNPTSSVHVRNEVDMAFNEKKKIICYRTIDIKPADDLNYYLCRQKWIDGTGAQLEELTETCKRVIGISIPVKPVVRILKKLWKTIKSIIDIFIFLFLIFALVLLVRDAETHECLYKGTTLTKILSRLWSLIKDFDYAGVWSKISGFFR